MDSPIGRHFASIQGLTPFIGACFIELEIFGKLFVFFGILLGLKDNLLEGAEAQKWADYLFMGKHLCNNYNPKEDVESYTKYSLKNNCSRKEGKSHHPLCRGAAAIYMYYFGRCTKKTKSIIKHIFIDSPMGNECFICLFETIS